MKIRNLKKKFSILAVSTSLLSVAPVSTVLAKNVGGGNWTYGYKWNYGWSNYYHGTKKHSASVAHNGDLHRNVAKKGVTAEATYNKIPATGLSYYWNVY
ncbi:lactococcin 972 family bacteriocin [Lactobacillus sp. ESL0681]|uniref:lactococcin 972 family bacteriocin n=1 Tax=Lactobacillus sp. ESL0681 TaxID=2983211 RepID=UPI0023F7B766|nr:lactococcin 972 family bacteriocin [Lactobacillus sp. ESL0681]WEV40965.1 lactococcin 972 family bacteriocin [Lactobacillus sp. ESL0681]